MKLLKKSQPQHQEAAAAVSPLADLKKQLTEARDAAEVFVQSVALKEKAASPLQPLPWHRMQLDLRYGRAATECALGIIAAEEKNNG